MDSRPLTREDVVQGYRLFLGREPESEGVIGHHLAVSRDLDTFRRRMLTGMGFQSGYSRLLDDAWAQPAEKARVLDFDERDWSTRPFTDLFDAVFAPRLGRRERTFRVLFETLGAREPAGATIVETGCLRSAGNWQGDGQSTLQFDHWLRRHGGLAVSVDASPVSVTIARQFCPNVQLVLWDSVSYLQFLARHAPGLRIDLLYLDSLDVDPAAPERAAAHHLAELQAAWPLLGAGSLVAIDDHDLGGGSRGKSALANRFLSESGARMLVEDYQVVWTLP